MDIEQGSNGVVSLLVPEDAGEGQIEDALSSSEAS